MGSDDDITFTFTPFVPSDEDSGVLTPPSSSSSFGAVTNSLRRSSRSLRNRLHSIAHDAAFVERVRVAYDLPVLTNARAGDWYVDPQRRQGGVYFKSTDGHAGEWMFSLRRLNLGLLEVLAEGGRGAIIVDSTRRGKRFPDSLSKTIPIWIAVMNAIAFPNLPLALPTLPQAVSATEANSITQKLPGFVADFLALGLDLSPVRRLQKPLRPLWLTPASPLPDAPPSFTEFTPLVLVTASRMVKGAGIEGEYIQGAGDDHEGWAQESGLTPALFWRHREKLLAARDDDELAGVAGVAGAIRGDPGEDAAQQGGCTLVRPTEGVYIGAAGGGGGDLYDAVVNCCTTAPLDHPAVVPFPVPAGKKGVKALRAGLAGVVRAVEAAGGVGPGRRVAVVCESGDEVAPVVALVLLCLFYDDEGRFRRMAGEERARVVDKAYIRRRLAWIAASRPSANPARGALNVVNSFLMERPA